MPKEYQHKTVAGFFAAHRERWIKGSYHESRKGASCFCLVGKVQDLYEDDRDRKEVYAKLVNAIEELHPTIFKRLSKDNALKDDIIIGFNDAEHRTINQIVEVAQFANV